MGIGDAYKRWRHTRGYGVHSPFAFSMIEAVVHPARGYALYGYEDIDNSLQTNDLPHSRRHARMLLRLASFLNVKSVFLPKDINSAPFRAALLAADSGMKISSALAEICRCDMICTRGDYVALDDIRTFMNKPGTVLSMINVPIGWEKELFDSLPEGLMFHSKTSLIMVHRPGMQKISYTIRL